MPGEGFGNQRIPSELMVGRLSTHGCDTKQAEDLSRSRKLWKSEESEACALLHMLEQLRQLLSGCVAVPAEPESVEYVHTESRPQSLQKAEGELKDTMGLMLREAWDKQGKSGCRHPERSKETSFSGTVTGWYLCTTCGHRVRMDQV